MKQLYYLNDHLFIETRSNSPLKHPPPFGTNVKHVRRTEILDELHSQLVKHNTIV
jgi:hypothetical protein